MWETVGMREYTPQVGDIVSRKPHGPKRFVVVKVDANKQIADLQSPSVIGMMHSGNEVVGNIQGR